MDYSTIRWTKHSESFFQGLNNFRANVSITYFIFMVPGVLYKVKNKPFSLKTKKKICLQFAKIFNIISANLQENKDF